MNPVLAGVLIVVAFFIGLIVGAVLFTRFPVIEPAPPESGCDCFREPPEGCPLLKIGQGDNERDYTPLTKKG
jgi:hypothetical protein